MTPSSREMEPPGIPGRFTQQHDVLRGGALKLRLGFRRERCGRAFRREGRVPSSIEKATLEVSLPFERHMRHRPIDASRCHAQARASLVLVDALLLFTLVGDWSTSPNLRDYPRNADGGEFQYHGRGLLLARF